MRNFATLIFTKKVHGQGKYLRKKKISEDFELKNYAQKYCLIYLEKIFWKGKRLVEIESAVLEIVEVTADTSRT